MAVRIDGGMCGKCIASLRAVLRIPDRVNEKKSYLTGKGQIKCLNYDAVIIYLMLG